MLFAAGETSPVRKGTMRSPWLEPDDQAELLRLAQNGDAQAFTGLVRAYQERMYRLAYRLLGDPESAADATQDALLSAFRNIALFRGGSLKAWLMRIVTNGCYDRLRKRKREPSFSLDLMTENGADSAWLIPSGTLESPEERAERRELNEVVQRGINRLPFEQRATLVMADIEGYTYQDIALITQANIGTVKSRLARARAALRDFLLAQEALLPSKYRLNSKKHLQ